MRLPKVGENGKGRTVLPAAPEFSEIVRNSARHLVRNTLFPIASLRRSAFLPTAPQELSALSSNLFDADKGFRKKRPQ